ncbi:MAG: Nicotinate-nucleotide--dimethylbenzimidazole phosphoribosyltransferase (EC [uncultured Thiotrichaceae bacterium]|uniref:Nicotinate-nucleotide--dimethylbenzimidazole phosphoribosyltransferase n=1 Tax=uncultured Thiotrichaceae bacterium TaxID=298394 RepID=A0A6S6TQF1_9GAMM|nr:MAG: Nicotinate-nucleotide--dimethylbenzimidazole phosphoribosyltransferase (EC [uncultured Thiotrichaceae bacterium]
MKWWQQPCQQTNSNFTVNAEQRQQQLTKPPGAMGLLETTAIRLAGLQGRDKPAADKIHISVFAGDHGVVAEGVSAFPQEVTVQMVHNFLQGGAAISVLARQLGATLEVVDTGIMTPLPQQEGLVLHRAGAGTTNSTVEAAMTPEQLAIALQAGHDAVDRAVAQQADLFIGGEMGIGNTTAATALYAALLDQPVALLAGAGTGLDHQGIEHKIAVLDTILFRHRDCGSDAMEWLRCTGGFEIAALSGAYLRAAQCGLPVLLDGFISTAAALVAIRIQPDVAQWLFLSHVSAEQGHHRVLEILNQKPLLDLGMRLGEGSGAAVAVSLIRSACYLHNEMATFAEAAVAGKLK